MTWPDPLALGAVIAYCGWDPTSQVTETVHLDGNGTFRVWLPSLRVTAVNAVVVTNWDGSTYTATIGPGNDVGWSENGTLTWQSCNNGARWPSEAQSISVTYTGGYIGIPSDLAAAIESLATRRTNPALSQGVINETTGPYHVGYSPTVAAGGFLTIEQMVLDKYRIVRAA
jgi:hypothetical protein